MPETITITTDEYRRLCEADLVLRALVMTRYKPDVTRLAVIDGLVDAIMEDKNA